MITTSATSQNWRNKTLGMVPAKLIMWSRAPISFPYVYLPSYDWKESKNTCSVPYCSIIAHGIRPSYLILMIFIEFFLDLAYLLLKGCQTSTCAKWFTICSQLITWSAFNNICSHYSTHGRLYFQDHIV
jgi:hypothetical protein